MIWAPSSPIRLFNTSKMARSSMCHFLLKLWFRLGKNRSFDRQKNGFFRLNHQIWLNELKKSYFLVLNRWLSKGCEDIHEPIRSYRAIPTSYYWHFFQKSYLSHCISAISCPSNLCKTTFIVNKRTLLHSIHSLRTESTYAFDTHLINLIKSIDKRSQS